MRKVFKKLENQQFKIETFSPKFSSQIIWEELDQLEIIEYKSELYEYFEDKKKSRYLKPEIIWEIERALSLTTSDFENAISKRMNWKTYTNSSKVLIFWHYHQPSFSIFCKN